MLHWHYLHMGAADEYKKRRVIGGRIHSLGRFQLCLMVLNGLNGYLNRHESIWIKFQLKPSILDPSRDI